MDFSDTHEQAEFRAEAAAWLDRIAGQFAPVTDAGEREAQSRDWQEALYQGGWLGLAWPVAYGGRGLPPLHEAIFNEECARRRTPLPVNVIGLLLAGPTIIAHGSEAQKTHYLPRILSAEDIWCQGFSEPGNGSDLAGLRTCAERVAGGFRVSGEKVWTSWGHLANKCLLLARTSQGESKHHGISYFLADTGDFDIRPLRMVNGDAEFNQMFIDDVFVAEDRLLGELDRGWQVAMTTLGVERTSVAFNLQVWARQALDGLAALAVEQGLDRDSAVLDRLGAFEAEVEAIRISTMRTTSAMAAGQTPGAESSTVKLQWARVVQDVSRFALELGGERLLLARGEEGRHWRQLYLRARGHSIEGGTDEIQKSIIAERVLGLPRTR